MSVNFFVAKCQSTITESLFGICDDRPNLPAYVDISDKSKWIAIVENRNNNSVTFTAIDNCIEILRPDGTMDSRCDGMIIYPDHLIFIELKERDCENSKWVKKGEDQLKNIIKHFVANHDITQFKFKKAILANKLKPSFASTQMTRMAIFEDDTGFEFIIKQRIIL